MRWYLPGTVLENAQVDEERPETFFAPMFMAGGMVLSQVSSITGLEPYIIQNWVKRGFLTPPQNKRYTLRQLCRILNINMLKGILQMDQICGMLGYINGALDDESDDLIDDSQLYFMFVRLTARARTLDRGVSWQPVLEKVLDEYQESIPGARERVGKVLRIMLIAYIAAEMKEEAESMLKEIQG